MRTSKKLLSFFLAVVMVVTTCSVGITAFGQDNSKSIWKSDYSAEDAFDTLNGLADGLPALLLQIDALDDLVGDSIYEKYIKADGKTYSQISTADKAHSWDENGDLANSDDAIYTASDYQKFDRIAELQNKGDEVTDDEASELETLQATLFWTKEQKSSAKSQATIQDILGALQPTLIEALAGTSQSEFVRDILGDSSTALKNYNYLNSDNTVSYYTLVALCVNYMEDDSLSKETRETLENWLYGAEEDRYEHSDGDTYADDSLLALAYLYQVANNANSSNNASIEAIADRFSGTDLIAGEEIDIGSASLYDLQNFDFNLTDEEEVLVNTYINNVNEQITAYGVDFKVADLPEMLYYFYGAGYKILNAMYYTNFINLAGDTVDYDDDYRFDILGEDVHLTLKDVKSDSIISDMEDAFTTSYGASWQDFADEINEEYGEEVVTADYVESYFTTSLINAYVDGVIYQGNSQLGDSSYYIDIVKGMILTFSDLTKSQLEKKIADQMPDGWKTKDCVLTDDELELLMHQLPDIQNKSVTVDGNPDNLAYITKSTTAAGKTTYNKYVDAEFFDTGKLAYQDFTFKDQTAVLPSVLKNTVASEYFTLVATNRSNRAGTVKTHWINFFKGFIGDIADTSVQISYAKDDQGEYLRTDDGYLIINNASYTIGSKDGRDENGNIETGTINGNLAEAEDYAYVKLANTLFAEAGASLSQNKTTGLSTELNVDAIVDNEAAQLSGADVSVTLTSEQKAVLNGNYDLTGEVGTELLNYILNNTVVSLISQPLLGDESIEDIVNKLLVTKISLVDVVDDIWANLMKSPVETLVNILPALMVVVDELLVPFLFNGDGDQWNGTVTGLTMTVSLISPMTYTYGSYIGIDQVGWDLNELLPNIIHWLMGDTTYSGITYYNDGSDKTVVVQTNDDNNKPTDASYEASDIDTADLKHYVVKDQDGRELKRTDSNGTTTYSYRGESSSDLQELLANFEKDEPVFTYYMTYSGDVPYLTGIYIADEFLKDISISDLKPVLDKLGDTAGSILYEVVTEIATLLSESVDEFISTPELRNATKYDVSDNCVGSGLNNVFVALPQLFDIMENLAADKYGVDQDAWIYCYDGKIYTESNNNNGLMSTKNSDLEEFKAFAIKPNAVEIFDCFAGIFVEDWLDAILSLLNNVISTDNEISDNLPIVSGLLNALGGFGEDSILTDVINGVFQIEREDDESFTFEKRDTGFTGLSKDHAYYLITNIDVLVSVIKNLTSGDASVNTDGLISNTTKTASSTAPTIENAQASSHTYTDKQLSNVTDLIDNLDEMLSSLLSDSSLNGFNLDSTDNILAAIISFVSNYLGSDCFTELGRLINSYTYYITGSDSHTADSNGDVDAKKVYTNDSMTGLMVETFLLIENVVETLFADFSNEYTLANGSTASYNLIVEAIEGLISPDAVSVRLDGYDKVASTLADYNCWHNAATTTSRGDYKISLDWGIKAGDKESFFNALSASLRLVTSILSVVLIDTGWYSTVVMPILNALCEKNDIKVDTVEEFSATTNGYNDEALLGILTPVSNFIDKFLSAPASTLINAIQGIAGILDDENGATIASIVKGAIDPLTSEIKGLGDIFDIKSDKLLATSPTLKTTIYSLADKLDKYSDTNNIEIKGYALSGANIIPIINTLLESLGIQLKQIDWNKLNTASSPAAALVYVFEYLLEIILDNDTLTAIAKMIDNDTVTVVIDALKDGTITPQQILEILNKVLEATDSPTLVYWTFTQYLLEATENFYYPKGVTKQMANDGVAQLDTAVGSIFELLNSFGINLGATDLQGIVSNNLFTNSLLTSLAKSIYGALDGLDPTVKEVLASLGVVTSTKDVAKLLTDKSYGSTFASAAKTIKAQSDWSKIKTVNWGFKDGSASAQQGFITALVGILRPFEGILEIFLNEGTLQLDSVIYDLIESIEVKETTTNLTISDGDVPIKAELTYSLSKGVFTLTAKESQDNRTLSTPSTLVIDLTSLKDTLKNVKIEGTNGYNSAIIPLLEVLGCSNVKTYTQYQKDVASAKDNLLLDILNPLVGNTSSSLLNKICASPVSTLTQLLPNLAMYIDGNGLLQLVCNLLAPITNLADLTGEGSATVDDLIKSLLGNSLQDAVIPLVNQLLESNDINITLPDIDWDMLVSLGKETTYTSKATGENGKALTGKKLTNIDSGKVLVTLLRFVGSTIVDNAKSLKKIVCNIDAVKNNKTISAIVKSVFNTLSTSKPDEIVYAILYLLAGDATDSFWDYSSYDADINEYTFTYPENVDVDTLTGIPAAIDSLLGNLVDLNSLIGDVLYSDELISNLAKGLYGAIEGVKVGDMTLTELLAQTDIDFSTANVAKLLTDKSYGQTYTTSASVIKSAGSWAKVDTSKLSWGVTDRDSFFHALVAVLRPLYGVLDVILNDGSLGIFNILNVPGSNGYTSTIIPLLEALSIYDAKTEAQYKKDMAKEYDAILLDIIDPLWDKVEEILASPVETIADMLPNIALFIDNDGICKLISNLVTPVSALLDAIKPVVDLNDILNTVLKSAGVDISSILADFGVKNFDLDVYDINETLKPVLGGDAIIPLINGVLDSLGVKITIPTIDWDKLISLGTLTEYQSKAKGEDGKYLTGKRVENADAAQVLTTVLRYVAKVVTNNISELQSLVCGIDAIKNNETISAVVSSVFNTLSTSSPEEIITALFYLLAGEPTDAYWDYSSYKASNTKFTYPEGIDKTKLSAIPNSIDNLISRFADLNSLVGGVIYNDDLISTIATGLYSAIEGVKVGDSTLTDILAVVGIDFTTTNVANLLVDKTYGETFAKASATIKSAGSWAKVNADSLTWGVTDRDSFVNALVAVLRPLYGVLDVILNDASLGILDVINIPGSNGYTSTIIPLLEALSIYDVKTEAEYKQDMANNYDAILLDIINPILDKVEDILDNPVETIAEMLPNIALFMENDGLCQLIGNLITPVSALLDAIKPVVDLNDLLDSLLPALGVDLDSLLASIGIKDFNLDVYDIEETLKPILGGDAIVPLLNSVLKALDVNITIPDINWKSLISLGTFEKYQSKATDADGQYQTGKRVVDVDQSKVLVTVLRYVATVIVDNIKELQELIGGIDAIKNNDTINSVVQCVFNTMSTSSSEELVVAVLYLFAGEPTDAYWDYSSYKTSSYSFSYPDGIDSETLETVPSAIDDLLGSFFDLNDLIGGLLYSDELVSKIATGLYGAIEGVTVGDSTLTDLLATLGIDFTTDTVASLLVDKSYGQTYKSASAVIESAGSWAKVNANSLTWGVTDRDSFFHALVAVLRPLYGVLDVILNDGSLSILDTLNIPGSNGYTSTIIPLLEAFTVYDVKTNAEYQKDMAKEYDAILLDIINPLWDKVEEILASPVQTLTEILPNVALFIQNDGLCQLIGNLITPVSALLDAIKPVVDLNDLLDTLLPALGVDLDSILAGIGIKNFSLDVYDIEGSLKPILGGDSIVPLINSILSSFNLGITIPDINWNALISLGTVKDYQSKATGADGKYLTGKRVENVNSAKVLVTLLRYVAKLLKNNLDAIEKLLMSIDAIKNNSTISSILSCVFDTLRGSTPEELVTSILYLLAGNSTNKFWDYTSYETGEYSFSYPDEIDVDFLTSLPPMLDGLIGGLVDLNETIGNLIFKDSIISSLATGLYGAIEGVSVGGTSLTDILALLGIDFTTENVANLLVDEAYGQTYSASASVIKSAGSWANVNADSLSWGVTDSDSFFHALVAVLRPLYGILDVLLNDASLSLFDVVNIPGSDGYTSSIVPLMEAFSMYNVKTQYEYRQDILNEYDAILLDIINPLWDKVEDILAAPLQVVASMLPNLALFIGNNGLCQIIDNLLTPVTALMGALQPIVNINDLLDTLLPALGVDLNSLLSKIGVTNFTLDLYDLETTLMPILGGDAIIPLVNNILDMISISGTKLGIQLTDVDWLQLASHGETIVSASQAATHGSRIYVEGDSSETLIAVLRYLIITINSGDNFQNISDLISGLIGGADDSVSDMIGTVLGMLTGDTDEVIGELVGLLQTLGG